MSMALAYAQQSGTGVSNVTVVAVGIGVFAVLCGLVFAVIGLVVGRRHRQREIIAVAAIFWAIICAVTVGKALLDQAKWSEEYLLRLQSGYYTQAQADADAPQLPWTSWTILAGVYGALLLWSFASPAAPRDGSS
jgi:drug/metabolite transporter (DMT)-like permease